MRRRLPAYSEHESYAITDSSSGIQFGNDSSNQLTLGNSTIDIYRTDCSALWTILLNIGQTFDSLIRIINAVIK